MPMEGRPSVGVHSYNVILIGDGGTGKTTYIRKVIDGSFTRNYVATKGAESHVVSFNTNKGYRINFSVKDLAGQDKNMGMGRGYFTDADAAIIMFDITVGSTLLSVRGWLRDVVDYTKSEKEIPVVLCGNKVDLSTENKRINERRMNEYLRTGRVKFIEISALNNYNFELPFLYLARRLTGDEDLVFTYDFTIKPGDMVMDPHTISESMKFVESMNGANIDDVDFADYDK